MSQIIEEIHFHPEVELWLKAEPLAAPNPHENAVSLDYLEIYEGSHQPKIEENVSQQTFAEYCRVSFPSTLWGTRTRKPQEFCSENRK
jgi:hypothetical protein